MSLPTEPQNFPPSLLAPSTILKSPKTIPIPIGFEQLVWIFVFKFPFTKTLISEPILPYLSLPENENTPPPATLSLNITSFPFLSPTLMDAEWLPKYFNFK